MNNWQFQLRGESVLVFSLQNLSIQIKVSVSFGSFSAHAMLLLQQSLKASLHVLAIVQPNGMTQFFAAWPKTQAWA